MLGSNTRSKSSILSFSLVLLLLTSIGRADSPLTSTEFYTAYSDVKLVEQAARTHVLNKEMAAFLSNPKTSIDQKAALINALGWNFDGQKNAAAFRAWLGRKSPTADEQFCLGYLTAMDSYQHASKGLPMLEKAAAAKPKSYTVALILALVKAQGLVDNPKKWGEIWTSIDLVNKNSKLEMDMRPEARDIVMEYMSGYKQ